MDPESDLPILEEDIKDEDSLENQNYLQFCKENFRHIIQSNSNIPVVYDFNQMEAPQKIEGKNANLNQNIKEEPRDVGSNLNLDGPSISSKSKGDTNSAHSLPTSLEEPMNNPWEVTSLFEFNYFFCPECEFKTRSDSIAKSAQNFVNHASHSHPWAVSFLQQISDGSIDDITFHNENDLSEVKVEIKSEPEEDFELPLPEFEIDADCNNYVETEMFDEPTNPGVKKLSVSRKKRILKKPKIIDGNVKPKMSLSQLISEALVNSHDGMLVLSDIVKSISVKYPFYKLESQKWQNSLKYTLSMKEAFTKASGDKGSFWTLAKNLSNGNGNGSDIPTKSDRPFNCDICGKSYKVYVCLKSHIAIVHEGKKPAPNETRYGLVSFRNRKKNQTDEKKEILSLTEDLETPYKCETCGKYYPSASKLTRHTSIVHEGKKPFSCSNCGKKYKSKGALEYHFTIEHELKELGIDETNMSEHLDNPKVASILNKRASAPKKTNCKLCGEEIYGKDGKILHIKEAHCDKSGNFKCPKCDGMFRSYKHIYNHIMTIHEKEPCTICGEMIGNKSMNQHMQRRHKINPPEKKNKCQYCGKGFISKNSLLDHENTHTGARPHLCKFCGKGFANSGAYSNHVRACTITLKEDKLLE